MARDPGYDILFEPVRIGPVTAKNRFYRVPHCNGMDYRDPSAMVEMRRVKAGAGREPGGRVAREADWAAAGIASVEVLGDARAPGTIAMAVYAGRRYAVELDAAQIGGAVPFRRELTELSPP
jgi:hypothetical protein